MDRQQANRNIAFIGRVAVGKTSLIRRLVNSDFVLDQYRPTIGATRTEIRHRIDGQEISFQLVDTAGEERYRDVVPFYLRSAHAAAICFDPTEPDWLEGVRKYVSMAREKSLTLPIALVATKSDTWPDGTCELFTAELASYGYPIPQTSASSGAGVEEAKERLLGLAMLDRMEFPDLVDITAPAKPGWCQC